MRIIFIAVFCVAIGCTPTKHNYVKKVAEWDTTIGIVQTYFEDSTTIIVPANWIKPEGKIWKWNNGQEYVFYGKWIRIK